MISASRQCENSESISKLIGIPINNVEILVTQLRIIHETTQNRSLKIRVTKLIQKLSQQENDHPTDESNQTDDEHSVDAMES